MSDDQDACEWVNVSSGTGPTRVVPDKGLHRCVCVCVCVNSKAKPTAKTKLYETKKESQQHVKQKPIKRT